MIRLYHKNLNSLDALRQEIAIKKAEAKATFSGVSDILPGAGNERGPEASDIISAGLDVFTSKGIGNKLWALAVPALQLAGRKLEKDILKSFAKEFLVGYAKWKAIELGYKAASSFFPKRKKRD